MITGIIIFLLIVSNVLFSWKGFGNEVFFDRYKFNVDGILLYRQYDRLISSGFLHAGWLHLIFNMIALYFFSGTLSAVLDWWGFLIIYFVSLIGGDLLSLFIHRHSGDYSSVGASGPYPGSFLLALHWCLASLWDCFLFNARLALVCCICSSRSVASGQEQVI